MIGNSTANERAVSPVVGVILMVAITVILAAVIGTFVLDLGNNQTAPPRAGISFSQETVDSGDADSAPDVNAVVLTLTDPGNVESLTIKASSDVSLGTTAASTKTICASGTTGGSCDGSVSGTTGTLQVVGTNNGQSGVVATYEYNLN